MKGINNSSYLIESIEDAKEHEIQKIRQSYEDELERFAAEQERLLKERMATIERIHSQEIEFCRRKHESQIELASQRTRLTTQAEFHSHVRTRSLELLYANPNLGKIVIENIIGQLKREGDMKEFHTPKGFGIGKERFDDFKVIGVVNENEEHELNIDDILSDHLIQQVKTLE
ncbi:MAG: hypothetical protein ACQESG_01210 [Nanobdellota archaeon]